VGRRDLPKGFWRRGEESVQKPEMTEGVQTGLLSGALAELPGVRVCLVDGFNEEMLWDGLVEEYHYLGNRRLPGRRLKYLAWMGERVVAALSWSSAALRLRVRDRWIGWSDDQRREHLDRVARNSRFVVFPWVRVENLASRILGLTLRRLSSDWAKRHGKRLWLVETFVDPRYYRGTCYRAANWVHVGQTWGSGKSGNRYVYHGHVKEVYLYVIERGFRDRIGCERQPYDPVNRPPLSTRRMEDLEMMIRDAGFSPQVAPHVEIDEQDVESLAEELVRFHRDFQGCFGRKEHERLGLAYLMGLLSSLKAKSVEPIALEYLGKESAVRSEQRFMKSYRWDEGKMLNTHQEMLAEQIAAQGGMLTVDSSEFPKKGKESVGVARQYCGRLGKVDNCQSGVFVGYCSQKGYGLVNTRLYMPKSWFEEEQKKRREDNKVPEDLVFQTKPQIASDLVQEVSSTGLFPTQWIGCDATFGADWQFLDSVPDDTYYFAQVRSDTRVFLKKPRVGVPLYQGRGPRPKKVSVLSGQTQAKTVARVAAKRRKWEAVVMAEGAKGPILSRVTALRVWPCVHGMPRPQPVWLFIRRHDDGQIKYAFSNAPADTALSELVAAANMRFSIEQCFREGKDQLGMDHYEHRSWPAWHRHMIYVFLAMLLLQRIRARFKKNSGAHAATGQNPDRGRLALAIHEPQGGDRDHSLPHTTQLCSLQVSPEKAHPTGKNHGDHHLPLGFSQTGDGVNSQMSQPHPLTACETQQNGVGRVTK